MPLPRQAKTQVVNAVRGLRLVRFEESRLLAEADMVSGFVGGVPRVHVGNTGEAAGFSLISNTPENGQNEALVSWHDVPLGDFSLPTVLDRDCLPVLASTLRPLTRSPCVGSSVKYKSHSPG